MPAVIMHRDLKQLYNKLKIKINYYSIIIIHIAMYNIVYIYSCSSQSVENPFVGSIIR